MHKRIGIQWIVISLGVIITACQGTSNEVVVEETPGLNPEFMDTNVSPAQDFFKYVNGKWLEEAEIPADRGRWGSFDELRQKTDENVLAILAKAGESDFASESSDQRKAAKFFHSGMDTAQIERVGMKPLLPYVEKVNQIQDIADLQTYLEETEPLGGGGFFSFGVNPDLKNSTVNAAYLGPGAIGLPDRDYYVKDDEESQRIQGDYKKHVARMMQFYGHDVATAEEKAEKIFALEKRMAENMLTKEAKRNTPILYNKRSIDELSKHLPSINWKQYLSNIGAGEVDTLIVTEPRFMEALADIFNEVPVDEWKDYLDWTTLDGAASFLNKEIEQANFDFFGKVLQGVEEMRPRNERILGVTNGTIGQALGKLYVGEYFPPEAKENAEEMVQNIIAAFRERIKDLDWMTDETKEKALDKLSTFKVKIGYPDKWKEYQGLDIKSTEEGGSYIENILAATKFNFLDDIQKIGKEVDKTEWFMAPQVVNAYYNPLYNEIVFPAAILQPPFYNFNADEAVNYGGIGAVIGHEISHGFDDQGSRFDKHGNLINWWTDTDREQFDARCQKLIDQFENYKPFEDANVNGQFTLGENIGDLGGLNVALDGLHLFYEKHGRPENIDGMTPEQRFFISWGTIWRTKMRDEALRTQLKTDPHSPGMYRAIGAPTNMTAFYDAFNIKEGDPMYRPDSLRVKIW